MSRLRQSISPRQRLGTLTERTRRAFSLAGRRYYYHDERWGCDLDLLRTVRLPERPRILELGCGPGILLRVAALLYPDYGSLVGVDYSASVCTLARKELHDLTRVQISRGDMSDYLREASPRSFDVVLLLNNTLGNCWFPGEIREGQRDLLAGIARTLSESGVAIVSVYSGNGIGLGRYGRELQLVEDLGDGSYVGRVTRGEREENFFDHLFEPVELPALLGEAGLKLEARHQRGQRLIFVCSRG